MWPRVKASEKSQQISWAPWVRVALGRREKKKPFQVRLRALCGGSEDAENHRSGNSDEAQLKGYLHISIHE